MTKQSLPKQNEGGQPAPQASFSPLWTRKQVADALQVCPHSVARYTRAGLLPALYINRRVVRYEPRAVQAFIAAAQGGDAMKAAAARRARETGGAE
jgi:hypothetical protein